MRISNTVLAGAICSVGVVIAAQTGAFEKSAPQDPNANFQAFVPPAVGNLPPQEATPEADLKAYREGNRAFQEGDVGTAIRNWEQLAERGDVASQWRLANMYRLGRGVAPDHDKAFRYYNRVAAQHQDVGRYTRETRMTVDALVQLARYYERGVPDAGIRRDTARAFDLYKLTATHFGHPGAQFSLGSMYLYGSGVKQSVARGLRWLNLSAQKHHAGAQAALGDVYLSGTGVRADRTKALMWYMLAQESAKAARDDAIIARYQDLYDSASAEQREQARAQAAFWQERYPPAGAKRN